jgi:hypothetical protein
MVLRYYLKSKSLNKEPVKARNSGTLLHPELSTSVVVVGSPSEIQWFVGFLGCFSQALTVLKINQGFQAKVYYMFRLDGFLRLFSAIGPGSTATCFGRQSQFL